VEGAFRESVPGGQEGRRCHQGQIGRPERSRDRGQSNKPQGRLGNRLQVDSSGHGQRRLTASQRVFTEDLQKKGTDTSSLVPRFACVSPHFLGLTRESTVSTLTAGVEGKNRFYPERRSCWKCHGQGVSGQFSGRMRPETNRGVKDDAMGVMPQASPLGDGARGGLCSGR